MTVRAWCAVHQAEHDYSPSEVVTLLVELSEDDWEDGPRCPRDVLLWATDKDGWADKLRGDSRRT